MKTYVVWTLLVNVCLTVLFTSSNVHAQLAVELTMDPEIPNRILTIGVNRDDISIVVRVIGQDRQDLEYAWNLKGPGDLKGENTPGIFYTPPQTIEGTAAQVEISVTVADDKGLKATKSLILTLVPAPIPITTSAPTPPPPLVPGSPTIKKTPTPSTVSPTPPDQNMLAQLKKLRGKVYAVIIGISDYQDPKIPDLAFTERDAQGFYEVLTDESYGAVPKEQVQLLLGKNVTVRNIKTAIGKWLAQQAGPEDTVIIFYSGHGAPEGEAMYWVTYDADVDNLYATALSNDEIHGMLQRIEPKRLITFLDACYSAATVNRTDRTKNLQSTIPLEKFSGAGRVAITASDGKQQSLELNELRHGVFTYYLIEGLRGQADKNRDGIIELEEVWDYVKYQVMDTSKKAGLLQTPVFQGSVTAGIPLAFNLPLLEQQNAQKVFEAHKERIVQLYKAGELSPEQMQKAIEMLEQGQYDRSLDDFLNNRIPVETFKKIF